MRRMTGPRAPGRTGTPIPSGRHELRYFDGTQWTEHVSPARPAVRRPAGRRSARARPSNRAAEKIAARRRQGRRRRRARRGGGTLFTEPVLVVNQKAKLIEINNEYAIFDQHGTQIGAVRQVGQSAAKKVLRVVADVDQFLTHKLQIVDIARQRAARAHPAGEVHEVAGHRAGRRRRSEIGQIVQQNVIGKIRFALEAGGQHVGSINAENWRAWNFTIQDHTGTEVARITKTWEGLAKTMFTTADNYVVQIHRQLEDRCAAWSSRPRCASTPPSSRTPAASTRRRIVALRRVSAASASSTGSSGRAAGRSPPTCRLGERVEEHGHRMAIAGPPTSHGTNDTSPSLVAAQRRNANRSITTSTTAVTE